MLGAPYAFPSIPPALGQLTFWAGVLGLLIYPIWRFGLFQRLIDRAGFGMVPVTVWARRAYEQTRHGTVGEMAAKGTDENGTLTWYAWYVFDKFQIYGVRPPSTVLERVDLRGYAFAFDGNEIIAKEQAGLKKWKNLQLKKTDAEAALKSVMELNLSFDQRPINTG